MSFLAPLYVAGLLAISLPILFHLIRRTPRGRQEFSSLMFLTPSPPTITRRSRLSNIFLLLLRAAALALLAFAFARPFLRRDAELNVSQAQGRRVALMVDTSASMRRGDLWTQARRQAEDVVAGLAPSDELALYFFDRSVRPAMTFAEWNQLDQPRRTAMVKARLAEAGPTWESTRLGDALATVAAALAEGDGPADAKAAAGRQLVLVSDLQEGGHVDALQGHQWPETVMLDVKPVAPKAASNAALQLVTDAADAPEKDASRLRVRIANQPDSTREQFSLAWANERGPVAGVAPVNAYVPPGRSQIVRVPWPTPDAGADRLVLSGDEADFDNTLFLVPPRTDEVRLVYLGEDAADDTKGLRYYLESALVETPRRKVDFAARKAAEPLTAPDLSGARLVVVAGPQADGRTAALRQHAEGGGDVLWVLNDAAAVQGLGAMTGSADVAAEEAPKRDFALLSRFDAGHPLFAPFADARFGDFTRVHFWRHRRLKIPDSSPARVVASFDDGDPFLVEQTIGKGRLFVMTSGWHPADSQLALSTKFVPLLEGLLRRGDGAAVEAQYAVGDPVALPAGQSPQVKRSVHTPDGIEHAIDPVARTFSGTAEPGIYRLTLSEQVIPLAVNVPADESRTTPLAPEELEQWGAKLGTKPVSDELATRQRQLQIIELENRQKLWRWLIVAVIGLLVAETALAGGLARRAAQQQQVTT